MRAGHRLAQLLGAESACWSFGFFLPPGLANYHVQGGNARLIAALVDAIPGKKTLSATVTAVERWQTGAGADPRAGLVPAQPAARDRRGRAGDRGRPVRAPAPDPVRSSAVRREVAGDHQPRPRSVHRGAPADRPGGAAALDGGRGVAVSRPDRRTARRGLRRGPPEPAGRNRWRCSRCWCTATPRPPFTWSRARSRCARSSRRSTSCGRACRAHVHSSEVFSYHPAAIPVWPPGRSPLDPPGARPARARAGAVPGGRLHRERARQRRRRQRAGGGGAHQPGAGDDTAPARGARNAASITARPSSSRSSGAVSGARKRTTLP